MIFIVEKRNRRKTSWTLCFLLALSRTWSPGRSCAPYTLLPQVTEPRTIARKDWEDGLYLVLIGLFKKVVIADNLSPLANAVFNRFAAGTAGDLSGAETMIGVYAFALQIYGDFSGYSMSSRNLEMAGIRAGDQFSLTVSRGESQ